MKYCITIILLLCFVSLYLSAEYQLKYNIFLNDDYSFNLDFINNESDNNFFYWGKIENIRDVIDIIRNEKEKIYKIKDGNHPLISISVKKYINNISLFPTETIFVIEERLKKYIKNEYNNYTLFAIYEYEYWDFLENEDNYYLTIGKKLDNSTNNILLFLIVFSLIINISGSIIIKIILKRTDIENILPIHYLITSCLFILFLTNVVIGIAFLLYEDKSYYFFTEYMTFFLYSSYKSMLYTTIFIVLLGYGTLIFFDWAEKFKNLNKKILLYDLTFSIIINVSIYFINISSKLNLFYIKNLSEHISLLSFIIYCTFKKLIPLVRQLDYEKKIRSDLVESIRFKLKRFLLTTILMATYCIFFMISPLIEYKYTYSYLDNYIIHLILQIFYETIFFFCLFIIYYPKNLPDHYFEDVVFTYQAIVVFLAKIGGKQNNNKKNDKKLNISNLKLIMLEKFSKKRNQPIVLINPFASLKNDILFKELHVGLVKKDKNKKIIT
jgi:hypothetical protein